MSLLSQLGFDPKALVGRAMKQGLVRPPCGSNVALADREGDPLRTPHNGRPITVLAVIEVDTAKCMFCKVAPNKVVRSKSGFRVSCETCGHQTKYRGSDARALRDWTEINETNLDRLALIKQRHRRLLAVEAV